MFDFGPEARAKPKQLRPHQSEAISRLRSSFGVGNRRVVIQGPTGFGKTLVAAKIIEGALAKGNRAIFTAPAISLIGQTVDAFETEGISDIGVMQANHPRTNAMAKVQVASVQTLARRDIPSASLVIVDECHLRSSVIDKMMDDRPDLFFVGLSATPWAKGMGRRWQDLVIPCTIADLIGEGYLSKFSVFAPDVPDLSRVRIVRGEYAENALSELMGDAQLVGSVVETWLAKGQNRPTLVFGVNRAHAQAMAGKFERAGIASAYVDAFTDRIERARLGRLFSDGELKVICSVRTMTTGVDLPVSCIVDAAPTRSEMLHVQKIGRGLRVNPGTEDCLILDHAGNSLRLGLVTDIHHDRLDDAPPGEKQEAKPKAEKLPSECSACGALHTGKTCPACGHERVPASGVEEGEGDLVQITGKAKQDTKADKQAFWSMALWIDRDRKKGGKLAKALYKGRFGVWPSGLSDVVAIPTQDFRNYEHSRRIAYAKRMQKRRAA